MQSIPVAAIALSYASAAPGTMARHIPGFHSETAFSFPDALSPDIVRVCAYHDKAWDRTVVWFPLSEHEALRNGRSLRPSKSTLALGKLSQLPLELLQHVILHLDMATLFRFSHISASARQAVDASREYRIVTTYAMNAFCALMRTNLASRVTLLDFYNLLCEEKCAFCPSLGSLVHLPSWTRSCPSCLQSFDHPTLLMLDVKEVKGPYKLSKRSLATLPILRGLPGSYQWPSTKKYKKRTRLISLECAEEAYCQEHPGEDPASNEEGFAVQYLRMRQNDIWCAMACCAMPCYSPQTNKACAGYSCAGCMLATDKCNVQSDMDRLDISIICAQVHSEESFLKHFAWCEYAQRLWLASDGGTREPPDLPLQSKLSHIL